MEEEALALSIQNLRIKLSKAEAQLAALKEARATKQNAKAEHCREDDTRLSTGDQNAKAEHCREDDTRLSTGDRVKLSWDRR